MAEVPKRNLGGRPPWVPSDKDRDMVRALTGYGIPAAEIAKLLGVGRNTLRRHCQREIDTGAVLANAKAAEFLFHRFNPPAGREITDERAATIAAMFWLKTRAKWNERIELDGSIEHRHQHRHQHHVVADPDKFIAELDQMAARLGSVPGREAGNGAGRSDEAADPDQKTVH